MGAEKPHATMMAYPSAELAGTGDRAGSPWFPKPEIFLDLDWRQMGAGGIDSWSRNAWPMEPYRIPSGEPYVFRYRLAPVGPPGH